MILIKQSQTIIFTQWIAGMGVTMLLLQMGFVSGWASPTLAKLTSPDSPIVLSPEQASWVASLVNLGRFFGGIIGAISASYLGSKRSVKTTLFAIGTGWFIIMLAKSVEWLYIARIFCGVGLGMAYSTFPLYIGEVSMPETRGALIALASCGGTIGQLLASIGSAYLNLTISSCIYLILCLMAVVMLFKLPESPHHLVKIGKLEDARKSITWYRNGIEVEKELNAVEQFVASDGEKNFIMKLRDFKTPYVRKAIIQIIALFTFMQICGMNSVLFYMEKILQTAHFSIITPRQLVILVNLCGIFAAILSIFLIDKYGRRFLLLTSAVGVSISMFILMSYFLLAGKVYSFDIEWFLMGSLFIFITSFWIGLFPVPSTVLSETFPANIKTTAASIASLTGATVAFFSSKTYQPLVDYLGEAYVFLIYAICSVIIIPYVLFFMQETKGKTLQQIQDELSK